MTREEYELLCVDKKSREGLARSLRSLKNNRGWQIVEMYIKEQIEVDDQCLHNVDHDVDLLELQKLRIKLYDRKELLDYPDTLARGLLFAQDDQMTDEVY